MIKRSTLSPVAALCAMCAQFALAGPGSSGGNPTLLSSMMKNYAFTAPAPTHQAFSKTLDVFDFELVGYRLEIATTTNSGFCQANNHTKTICVLSPTKQVVVFGDGTIYTLTFIDKGVGSANLATIAAETTTSFVEFASQPVTKAQGKD